jgi:hypothetical protein
LSFICEIVSAYPCIIQCTLFRCWSEVVMWLCVQVFTQVIYQSIEIHRRFCSFGCSILHTRHTSPLTVVTGLVLAIHLLMSLVVERSK